MSLYHEVETVEVCGMSFFHQYWIHTDVVFGLCKKLQLIFEEVGAKNIMGNVLICLLAGCWMRNILILPTEKKVKVNKKLIITKEYYNYVYNRAGLQMYIFAIRTWMGTGEGWWGAVLHHLAFGII